MKVLKLLVFSSTLSLGFGQDAFVSLSKGSSSELQKIPSSISAGSELSQSDLARKNELEGLVSQVPT